jgi:hypothetical protein
VPLPRRLPQQQQQRPGGLPQARPPPAGMNRARFIAQQEAEVRGSASQCVVSLAWGSDVHAASCQRRCGVLV